MTGASSRLTAACAATALLAAAQPSLASWALDGVLSSTDSFINSRTSAAPDGYGGVLITWTEDINQMGASESEGAVFVQRIATDGTVIWGPSGVKLTLGNTEGYDPHVVTDGEGGAIVIWSDYSFPFVGRARIQRVNFLGSPSWNAGGLLFGPGLTSQENAEALIPDGVGGALVVFGDFRNGNLDLYLQKVDAAGAIQWGNGVAVCTAAGIQYNAQLMSDGEGGAIAIWADRRTDPAGDIYAQRINFLGTALWTANGVAISTVPGGDTHICMTTDGASGLITAWSDATDVFAQRLNYAGTVQWTANGEPISTVPLSNQFSPTIAPDDNGGAFIAWVDTRSVSGTQLYGAHVDASGAPYWTPDGIPLSGPPSGINSQLISAARDESGGVIVTWATYPAAGEEVRALRADSQGTILWDEPVTGGNGEVDLPQIIGSGPGEGIVVWRDRRAASYPQFYAMKVPFIASGVDDRTPSIGALRILSVSPNPFNETAEVRIDGADGATLILEIFDVAGRRVWSGREAVGDSGRGSFRIRARDESGAALASGVYFLRVTSYGVTATHRFVVLR